MRHAPCLGCSRLSSHGKDSNCTSEAIVFVFVLVQSLLFAHCDVMHSVTSCAQGVF